MSRMSISQATTGFGAPKTGIASTESRVLGRVPAHFPAFNGCCLPCTEPMKQEVVSLFRVCVVEVLSKRLAFDAEVNASHAHPPANSVGALDVMQLVQEAIHMHAIPFCARAAKLLGHFAGQIPFLCEAHCCSLLGSEIQCASN